MCSKAQQHVADGRRMPFPWRLCRHYKVVAVPRRWAQQDLSGKVKTVSASEVPEGSLLNAYVGGGACTDCYSTTVTGSVSQAQYVEAFYTTPLFKLERALLRLAFSPSARSKLEYAANK